jgi:N-acetylmuramoyl-L-alanine amidase
MMEKPKVEEFVASPHFSSRRDTKIDRIVLHYTTSRNVEGSLAWWQMPQAKVSAHYAIGRDGTLYQAVKDEDKAWHAMNANPESIGIEFAAAPGDRMTPEQEATGVQLIRWLVETYSIPWEKINGHRYTPGGGSTDCPNHLFGEATEAAVLEWVNTKAKPQEAA